MKAAWLAAATALGLAACATHPPPPEKALASTSCPTEVPAGTQCWAGQDSAGAYVMVARPANWAGTLVLHAHGGPTLGPPKPERVVADLKRWAVMVRAGYAWAGTSFHQGGVAVRSAAADIERLQRIAVQQLGTIQTTVLHGQSWGASVAAKAAEIQGGARGTAQSYDAVLLTSGVLGGGSRSYDFRLDLRVVYQALCHNHPRPSEPAYPLWMGLPEGSTMTAADLAARTRECLGIGQPAAERSPVQAERLKTIVDVIHIPARSVQSHLSFATFTFRDIARRSGGKPVFGNIGVRYRGSSNDDLLNETVARYAANPAAQAGFAADTDLTGQLAVPTLTVHAIDDPTAFVELESAFAETVAKAGHSDRLLQTFTLDHEHSYLADPDYPAAMAALLDWVHTGRKPTPQDVAGRCMALQTRFGPGCRFEPTYQPSTLASRVPERHHDR
ncbi:MAG: hypothetical protein M3Y32_05740 [Pseudomonadota bacterium]|nr:hypothetical protein [Pseudomonadota bacterium]